MLISDRSSDVCSSDLWLSALTSLPVGRSPRPWPAGFGEEVMSPCQLAVLANTLLRPAVTDGHGAPNCPPRLPLLRSAVSTARMYNRRQLSMMLRQWGSQIGRAHVLTPVTNAHPVCRLLLEKKKQHSWTQDNY